MTAGGFVTHRPALGSIEFEGLPDGAAVWSWYRNTVVWRPTLDDVGRHEFVEVAEIAGRRATSTVRIDVLAPKSPGVLLAMGDSVASGHGLSRADYLGLDSCWRSERSSYSGRVARALGRGVVTDHALVACAGARTPDLWRQRVTGGPDDIADRRGRHQTQLDWALFTNPEIITLTVGANDLRFDRPDEFFSSGRFSPTVARTRVASMREDLAYLIERLVSGTDATIVVTTIHNPVSRDPHGVSGCGGECFRAVADSVSQDMNDAIRAAAARHRGRVVIADPTPAFVGHEAPNGRGPDWLRGGRGWFVNRLPVPTRGVHPYCEEGHSGIDTWINAADCVHPNGEGHQAYADSVMAVLPPLLDG